MRLDVVITENPLNALRSAAFGSPLWPYLIRRMRSPFPGLRIDTLYFCLALLLGLFASAFHLLWRNAPALGGFVFGVSLLAFVCQAAHAWTLPKRIWREFASSPALEDLSTTPLPPQQILGPFMIAAYGSVLRSLMGIMVVATAALYTLLGAPAGVRLGTAIAIVATVGVTGCLAAVIGPILVFAEALFWYLSLWWRSGWLTPMPAAGVVVGASVGDVVLSIWIMGAFDGVYSGAVSIFGGLFLWLLLQLLIVCVFNWQGERLLAKVFANYQALVDRVMLASRL